MIELVENHKVKIKKIDNQNDNNRDDRIIHHPFSLGVIAPKGGGKSTLLIRMLTMRVPFYRKFFHEIHIFSPTCKSDEKWDRVLSKLQFGGCYSDFDEDILENILERNKEVIESQGKEKSNRILIIFDDMISHPSFKNSNTIKRYLLNSRHLNCSFIYTTQKYNLLNPTIRNNLSSICFFRTENKMEYKTFKQENNSLDDHLFDEIYEYATKDPYSFLTINYQNPNLKNGRYMKGFEVLKIIDD